MVLTILHPTSELAKQEDLNVDIVAVHGLSGDSTETWAGPTPNASWLQEFLPHDVKDSRVLTFGYNANWAFGNTTADIRDHAKDLLSDLVDKRIEEDEARRPIIFIAHSLGGIIVKQALLLARIEHRYESIYQQTIGITFFGTPHRGSEIADYGGVLSKIATNIMHKPDSKLIRALKSNSDELVQLTSDFRHQVPQYSIVSFYELKPMGIPRSLIVDKKSALLEVFGEDQIPVDANHRDMCKFGTRKDVAYEKLFNRIRRILKEHNTQGVDAGLLVSKPFNEYYDVPYNVSSVFTGREDICQKLRECCLPSVPQSAQTVQKRFVLHGLGGAGKTQLCLKFAQDFREKFWGIFFVDASSIDTVDQGFLTIAQQCGLGEDVGIVKRWLANADKPWLLILDNADDPSMNISNYFSTGGRGTILITSRNPECTAYCTVGSNEISGMALDDALTLLLRVSGEKDVSNESLRTLAKRVVETLGCLALAIVHAGALVKQKLYNLEDYCEAYSRNRQGLFGHQTIHTGMDYKYTVYTTWEVSIEMIRKLSSNNPTNSSCWSSVNVENALDLLNIFSFLHLDNIPVEILQNAWRNWQIKSLQGTLSKWTKSQRPRLLCGDGGGDWDPVPTREAVYLLSSFSLVRFNDSSNHISIHPLVHTWIRDRLTQPERAGCWISAVSTLSASFRPPDQNNDYQYGRSLIPHISSCLKFTDYGLFAEGSGITERLWMADTFVKVYYINGYYKLAYGLSAPALELCKRTLAADEEICLQFEEGLVHIYYKLGEHPKAVYHQEKILQIASEMEEEHPVMLNAKRGLANLYNKIGRDSEALEIQKCILHTSEKVLGDKHLDTLDIMQDLACSYLNLGQYQAAVKLQEKELHVRKNLFNYGGVSIITSVSNLATIYSKMNRYEESLELSEEILRLTKMMLGDEHPKTITCMGSLASIYMDVDRAQEALELSEEALQLKKKILGDNHPDTLSSMENLALSYMNVGRAQEALELIEAALQLSKKILGDNHPATLLSLNKTAIYYEDVGRIEEAIELVIEAVDASRKTLGEVHPDTIDYTRNLDRLKTKYGLGTEGNNTGTIPQNNVDPIKSHGRRGVKRRATSTLPFPGRTV